MRKSRASCLPLRCCPDGRRDFARRHPNHRLQREARGLASLPRDGLAREPDPRLLLRPGSSALVNSSRYCMVQMFKGRVLNYLSSIGAAPVSQARTADRASASSRFLTSG